MDNTSFNLQAAVKLPVASIGIHWIMQSKFLGLCQFPLAINHTHSVSESYPVKVAFGTNLSKDDQGDNDLFYSQHSEWHWQVQKLMLASRGDRYRVPVIIFNYKRFIHFSTTYQDYVSPS